MIAEVQRWIRLHSSSNIVGATHAHYAWFTKTYGLYPSHDALQVPTLLRVAAYVCTPLPTRTQQLPILSAQQCWGLLRPFARNLKLFFGGGGGGYRQHKEKMTDRVARIFSHQNFAAKHRMQVSHLFH